MMPSTHALIGLRNRVAPESAFEDAGGIIEFVVKEKIASVDRYTTDITDVQSRLTKLLGPLTLNADGHTAINAIDQTPVNDINTILNDINTILTNAPQAVNDANATAAEAVRTAHLDVQRHLLFSPLIGTYPDLSPLPRP
jgi:hypothetical protein